MRMIALAIGSVLGLAAFGLLGSILGGAKPIVGALRVGAVPGGGIEAHPFGGSGQACVALLGARASQCVGG